jgi:hypothetical protein
MQRTIVQDKGRNIWQRILTAVRELLTTPPGVYEQHVDEYRDALMKSDILMRAVVCGHFQNRQNRDTILKLYPVLERFAERRCMMCDKHVTPEQRGQCCQCARELSCLSCVMKENGLVQGDARRCMVERRCLRCSTNGERRRQRAPSDEDEEARPRRRARTTDTTDVKSEPSVA